MSEKLLETTRLNIWGVIVIATIRAACISVVRISQQRRDATAIQPPALVPTRRSFDLRVLAAESHASSQRRATRPISLENA
jgi:hypothetical protein